MARREPVQKRSRERVEAILRGANELIASEGVENLSTRALAAHTGIPVATIYRYFEDWSRSKTRSKRPCSSSTGSPSAR
jgi:AcrR family transcriptional regulator